MPYIIGIDIGGTKTAVSLGTDKGRVISRAHFSTKGVRETFNHTSALIRAFIAGYGGKGKRILGIGISCAGPLDLRKGILLSAPNMPSWRNVTDMVSPLRNIIRLSRHFNLTWTCFK